MGKEPVTPSEDDAPPPAAPAAEADTPAGAQPVEAQNADEPAEPEPAGEQPPEPASTQSAGSESVDESAEPGTRTPPDSDAWSAAPPAAPSSGEVPVPDEAWADSPDEEGKRDEEPEADAEDDRTVFLPAAQSSAPTPTPSLPVAPEALSEPQSEGVPACDPDPYPDSYPDPYPDTDADTDAERTIFMPSSGTTTSPFNPTLRPDPLAAPDQPPATTAAPLPAYTQPPPLGFTQPAETAGLGVGDVLNGIYKIERFLARGGMGEVFEGFNIHHPEERVAIKLMLPQMAQDETVAAMFVKEATTLGKLQHEYLVQYRLAARDPQGRPFIVTEYVPGPSLEDRLKGEKLSPRQLLTLWRKLAQGLGAAHDFGAIHRDIAPDNILLHSGNIYRPKIIDFGIAKDLDTAKGTIVGEGFAGKLRYVAPEQLGDRARDIGPWTDLYSLALVMLALATGKDADMGGSIRDAVMKRTKVPDLSGVPAVLHPLFDAALQPETTARPSTMAQMIALIDKMLEQPGIAEDTGLADGSSAKQGKQRAGKAAAGAAGGAAGAPAGKQGSLLRRADGGLNWPVLAGGAAAGVLALALGVVALTSGGPDLPAPQPIAQGDETAAPQQPAQTMADAAREAALVPECSWLALVEADAGRAVYTGGTAKAVAAQNAMGEFFAAAGHQNVALDTSQVVSFPETFCPALAALREFRSPVPLARTPRSSYEMEMRSPMNRPDEQSLLALPVWEIVNLAPDDDFLLFNIDQRGEFFVFARDRKAIENFVRKFGGGVNQDGIRISWDVEDKGSYGLGIIAGKGDFPLDVLPPEGQPIPTTAEWARKFRQIAAERGWRVDILWYRVTDDVPD